MFSSHNMIKSDRIIGGHLLMWNVFLMIYRNEQLLDNEIIPKMTIERLLYLINNYNFIIFL